MSAESIDVPGLGHGGMPIPTGCRVGPLLVSGGIGGTDPATGVMPADGPDQVLGIFENVRRFLKAAGATEADVAKMTFFVVDRSLREHINTSWVEMFPDEGRRPARHTLVAQLAAPMVVQCEVLAYVEDGSR
ncbi:hypothetical protein GCM10009836_61190 [Pseudonocardia ailaonensis]|uniref:Enamine deaminase RidA n=1 Tax=Pseudonocardia ailaonensis TaxID=367279 RepID=A0ABN2NK55_9PSEU